MWRRTLLQLGRKLRAFKRRVPILANVRLNFIALHYAYITAVSLIGAIILFPGGGMSFTDALVFSTGSATQSGLNPIDLNKILTYQQVWLWIGSMIANPIVIHSSVVFVRLYSFEKRFQHIVRETKSLRREKSRANTMSRARDDDGASGGSGGAGNRDISHAEMGIRGKKIEVLRDSSGKALGRTLDSNKTEPASPSESSSSTKRGDEDSSRAQEAPTRQESDQVSPASDSPGEVSLHRLSMPRGDHRHLQFLENQRRETGALWIPSPREFDRGGVPEALDDAEMSKLARRTTTQSDRSWDRGLSQQQPRIGGPHITIDEPPTRPTQRTSTFPRVGSRAQDCAEQGTRDRSESNPPQRVQSRRDTILSIWRSRTQGQEDMPYLSWQPTIGRNSAFVDLTDEQREELGGIEYRSLKTLAKILVGYFFGFHLLAITCLVPWIMETTYYGNLVREVGQGRPWWGIFMAGSTLNDQGFSLMPDSMVSFSAAGFPLLLMAFLIIIGNTGFPCMLRFIIWVMWKIVPRGTPLWDELHFLLDHPRRCFTLLFPRNATWWLFGVLVILNGIDLILFLVLDINTPAVSRIPGGIRLVDGIFQAASTRTAGTTVVSLIDLHPAVQVSYMISMYISAYPIAISLRRTNVYEERSLGIYHFPGHDDDDEEDLKDETGKQKEPSYVGAHLRRQLGYDLWFITLGWLLIAIIEGRRLGDSNDYYFSLFPVLFEIVSAYGTVGLSLGYPNTNTAFCAQFRNLSKLVIIAMEIRGRHRGLPYALDRAVLLPSESLQAKEALDASRRLRRRSSAFNPVASAARSDNPLGNYSGFSTGRQRPHDNPDAVAQRPVETGAMEKTPSNRHSDMNAVTRLPTHPEQC